MGNSPQPIDWPTVVKTFPDIAFFHRDDFTKPGGGTYGWCDATHCPTTYFDDFAAKAVKYESTRIPVAPVNATFDDRKASWSKNRYFDPQNGLQWLNSFAAINAKFSATHQLPYLQIVTYNDHDEGSGIEYGIDNGIVLTPSVSNGIVTLTVTAGNKNAVDHYEVNIGSDSWSVASTFLNVDLKTRYFDPGTYPVQYKAVGKARFQNKYSDISEVVARLAWGQ
jgi:hypothetical protein